MFIFILHHAYLFCFYLQHPILNDRDKIKLPDKDCSDRSARGRNHNEWCSPKLHSGYFSL